MLLGVVSDTHNRYGTASRALAVLRGRGVATVLHCGDVEDVATASLFRGFSAHFVLGNCDRDREGLRGAVEALGGTLHEPYGHLEMSGRSVAFLHGDDAGLLRDLERSGAYDFLFHGHTHEAGDRQSGVTRVLNPGALHRARPKTFLIVDLVSGAAEWVPVE